MIALAAAAVIALSSGASTKSPAKAEASTGSAKGMGIAISAGAGPQFTVGNGASWFGGGVRFGLDLVQLSPQVRLSLVVPIWFAAAHSVTTFSTVDGVGMELTPGVRASLEAFPKLRVYGDLGIGAAFNRFDVRLAFGNTRATGTGSGFAARVGLGGEYAVLDNLSIFLEPMQLLFQTGPATTYTLGNTTVTSQESMPPHWQLNVGLTYRL